MAETALCRLQDRLFRVREIFRTLQEENASLKQRIQELTRDLEELKKDNDAKQELMERLENDRLKIRTRVETILKQIAILEEPTRESSL